MQFSLPIDHQALGLYHNLEINDPTAPTIFMVHGRAGDCKVMLAFKRLVPSNWNFLLPEAPFPDAKGGNSWWRLESTTEEQSAEQIRSLILLGNFIEKAPTHYKLRSDKFIGIGFSQGAAILSEYFLSSPRISALAMLAGFLRLPKNPTPANNRPVLIAHGTADDVVSIDRALAGAESLKAMGYAPEIFTDDVGHKVGTNATRALKDWLLRVS